MYVPIKAAATIHATFIFHRSGILEYGTEKEKIRLDHKKPYAENVPFSIS